MKEFDSFIICTLWLLLLYTSLQFTGRHVINWHFEQKKLVLSTRLIIWVGHRKEFQGWSFERYAKFSCDILHRRSITVFSETCPLDIFYTWWSNTFSSIFLSFKNQEKFLFLVRHALFMGKIETDLCWCQLHVSYLRLLRGYLNFFTLFNSRLLFLNLP